MFRKGRRDLGMERLEIGVVGLGKMRIHELDGKRMERSNKYRESY